MLKLLGGTVQVDVFEGIFSFDDDDSYREQLARIMAESVNPPKKALGHDVRSRSKLRASLRRQFLQLGLLAERPDEINDHKVVTRYPIEATQGLFADFALKNSVMHVTATVDFTMSQSAYTAKKYEAQAKCLVLKAASEICGADTKKYAVVAGGGKNTDAALNLLSANAQIFRFESASDMTTYLDTIQTAALGRQPLH
jgi:hypothetical protein